MESINYFALEVSCKNRPKGTYPKLSSGSRECIGKYDLFQIISFNVIPGLVTLIVTNHSGGQWLQPHDHVTYIYIPDDTALNQAGRRKHW